jgi:hypothetical protein
MNLMKKQYSVAVVKQNYQLTIILCAIILAQIAKAVLILSVKIITHFILRFKTYNF